MSYDHLSTTSTCLTINSTTYFQLNIRQELAIQPLAICQILLLLCHIAFVALYHLFPVLHKYKLLNKTLIGVLFLSGDILSLRAT
jgi:hypothetical protein